MLNNIFLILRPIIYLAIRKKQIISLLAILIFFLSCTNKQKTVTETPVLDSLAENCYTLLLELQTDTLRMAAEMYMKAATPYSREYFKARQYYINSYFNARDYDKVLALLTATEKLDHFNDYPAIVCDYMYTRARTFQYARRYPEAIEAFKSCLNFTPQEEDQDKILPTIVEAMTQLMNTFIFSGNLEEGYRCFKKMKEHPAPTIQRFALRDLYSHLGYLAGQAGHTDEAYRIADSVFVLPLHNPTPEKLFRNYSYGAVVFFDNPDARERVIEWLEQALEQADKTNYTAGIEWSTNLLANLYWLTNRMEEGVKLHYKALAMAKKRGDKGAECTTYIDLCTLYKKWELYKQANEYVDQAIAVILPTDNYQLRGTAYRIKAEAMSAMNLPDSVVYYYKKSEEAAIFAKHPVMHRLAKAGMGRMLIEHYSGDSLAQGIKLIQETLQEVNSGTNRSYDFYFLGKGLIKQGHTAEGEAMLDSMYKDMSRVKNATYMDGVLEYTIDHYLSRNNERKVMQYASIYREQTDVRYNEKISRKITSSMVQYQTEKKEQQLKLTKTELSVKNLRIKLYIVALILLFLVLIGGFLWYLHKRKLQKHRQLLAEQEKQIALQERELAETRLREQEIQLASALDNLRDANLQSEQIREQLNEFFADRENQQGIASITPSLFREKGEVKFRRYFTQLYPNFLSTLKERVPEITRSEEILSMLIALEQNMDEVADILCIEKKSVKMTRYRLRKKTRIEQEESLDEFIMGLK